MSKPTSSDYAATLATAKAAIQAARTRAVLAMNSEIIELYWRLGRLILDRQAAEGPRTRVVQRLSSDLRAEFSGMRGLSPGNLDLHAAPGSSMAGRVFPTSRRADPVGPQPDAA
jgi:DUF1016 N-terminal domain